MSSLQDTVVNDNILSKVRCPLCGAQGRIEYVCRFVLRERYRLTYLNDVGDFDHDLISSVQDDDLSYTEYHCGECDAYLAKYSDDLVNYIPEP